MGSRSEHGRLMLEGPKRSEGLRAPLFARLFDDNPRLAEVQPRRVLDRRELLESIRVGLGRLFNTRAVDAADDLARQERTVVNYGVADFLTFSPTRERDR